MLVLWSDLFQSFRSWITFLMSSIKPQFAYVLGLWGRFLPVSLLSGPCVPYIVVRIHPFCLYCKCFLILLLWQTLQSWSQSSVSLTSPLISIDGSGFPKLRNTGHWRPWAFHQLLTVSETCWGTFSKSACQSRTLVLLTESERPPEPGAERVTLEQIPLGGWCTVRETDPSSVLPTSCGCLQTMSVEDHPFLSVTNC